MMRKRIKIMKDWCTKLGIWGGKIYMCTYIKKNSY